MLAGPTALCDNYTTLPLFGRLRKQPRQYLNEYVWLSLNKTLFTKTVLGLDMAQSL